MPDGTLSVKRTLTTEFLVEVEDERAEMLCMCQETARKILNPIESDEMNMKRIVCCMKRVPIPTCQIGIDTFPESANVLTDSDWAGQPQTCRSRSEGIVQWRKRDTFCVVQNATVSEAELSRGRAAGSDHREPRRQSSGKGTGIEARVGAYETRRGALHVRARTS